MNHEHAVLGAALISPSHLPIVCGELTPDDFYTPEAATVFAAIDFLWREETPVDLVTLTAKLEHDGNLERVGGIAFLCDLLTYIPTVDNTRAYIDLLHESRRRRIFNRGMRTAIDASENGEDGFLEIAQNTLNDINGVGAVEANTLYDILPEVTNRLGDTTRGILTGFTSLDVTAGGFVGGHLIIIAARPGIGKTAMACNIAANMCRAGKSVAYFSLEMMAVEIGERMLLSEAQVNKYEAQRSASKQREVIDMTDKVSRWKMFVDDRGSISVGQIVASCHKLKQQRSGLDCVFVDYLQLIRIPSVKGDTRNERLGEVSRALKLMAKDLQCPVVALSQLNRQAEGRTPTIADLRESGAIEQDADMVLLLHREAVNSTETRMIIGKNRHGRTGGVPFIWHPEYTRFIEPAFKSTTVPKGVFND